MSICFEVRRKVKKGGVYELRRCAKRNGRIDLIRRHSEMLSRTTQPIDLLDFNQRNLTQGVFDRHTCSVLPTVLPGVLTPSIGMGNRRIDSKLKAEV